MFVEELDEIPEGAVTVFSAHGVSTAVEGEAKRRHLPVIDATCPLVTKVHKEGRNHSRKGREVILIGHAGHPEVEGHEAASPAACIWFPARRTSRRSRSAIRKRSPT